MNMIGKVLNNKYRLIELIGTGGMAHVYKAVQITPPHRTVAVKILKEEYADAAAFLHRFDMEAQAVLGLSHEHIVRSVDVGQQGSLHYIVLEYVEGITLKKYIEEKGPLQPRTAIGFGAQILDALSHAHEAGIIHRDVKPQNVMVTPRGKLKLADFGIARNTANNNTMTFAGGGVLGSVHYISPEQAKGQPVTVESDIYSMGILLYEMVTGSVPFVGDNSVSIALKHLQEEMVPPIALVPDMPPALNDIIIKATQKNPAQRYHSARAMRRDLVRVVKEPAGDFAKLSITNEQRTLRARKKRRGMVRIVFITTLTVGLFLSLFLIARSMLQKEEDLAELVPTLVGKTTEEAKTMAELRGYQLTFLEPVPSDTYERGYIVAQTPMAGAPLRPGGTITVTASSGPDDTAYVPQLVGLPLVEAEEILAAASLVPVVEYRTSEQPAGTVIQQNPEATTALFKGDEVEVYVSGEQANSLEIPNVTNLPLADALRLLKDRGFQNFYVRYAETYAVELPTGTVVRQTPMQGELASADRMVALAVSLQSAPQYAAEITCTLNVPQDDMEFYAVVNEEIAGIAYQQVVFLDYLRAGDAREITFTALHEQAGEREVLFLLGSAPAGSAKVLFRQAE